MGERRRGAGEEGRSGTEKPLRKVPRDPKERVQGIATRRRSSLTNSISRNLHFDGPAALLLIKYLASVIMITCECGKLLAAGCVPEYDLPIPPPADNVPPVAAEGDAVHTVRMALQIVNSKKS